VKQNHGQISGIGTPVAKQKVIAAGKRKSAIGLLEGQEIEVRAIGEEIVTVDAQMPSSGKCVSEDSSVIGHLAMTIVAVKEGVPIFGQSIAQEAEQSIDEPQNGRVAA
jgi:hypothetical protein